MQENYETEERKARGERCKPKSCMGTDTASVKTGQ